MSEDKFRGWTKPGPQLKGRREDVEIGEHESFDAISGYFRLVQLREGHRFSTDDVLTAWYGTSWCARADRVLDLGSGIGTVGMIAAWRLPGARVVTVEAQAESVALARRSAEFNELVSRYDIREGDFRDAAMFEASERFDLVLGSPPYFPLGTGVTSGHAQKIACRFELRGDVKDYCRVASERLAPGGFVSLVFPEAPESAQRLIDGARQANLSLVRRRPVVFSEGEAPLIGLFGLMRSDDLPPGFRDQTWVEPALVIRTRDGRVHPEYQALKLSIGFPP